jgi:hypothetical protein
MHSRSAESAPTPPDCRRDNNDHKHAACEDRECVRAVLTAGWLLASWPMMKPPRPYPAKINPVEAV